MAHVRKIQDAPANAKPWECRWSFTGPDGKRRFRKARFRTKAEADAKKRAMEERKATGRSVDSTPGKQAFRIHAEAWFDSLVSLKPSTLKAYRSILNTSVYPTFAYQRIDSITPADIRNYIVHLQKDRGLAPPTIHRHHGVLRLVLAQAVEDEVITFNPAASIGRKRLPTDKSTGRQKPEPVFLMEQQVANLAAQLPAPYDLLVQFLAYTGLRVAECSGLNVGDVDLGSDRQIRVRRTRTKVKGGWTVHGTKNGKPRRVPLLPAWLRVDMATYLENHPNRHDPDAPLWPGTSQLRVKGESGGQRVIDWDKPWEPGTFHKRQYKPALVRAGLPRRTRLHDLRHTAASLMLDRGIEATAAAEYLGHSYQVLVTTYAHLLPDAVKRHSDLFADRPQPAVSNVVPLHKPA